MYRFSYVCIYWCIYVYTSISSTLILYAHSNIYLLRFDGIILLIRNIPYQNLSQTWLHLFSSSLQIFTIIVSSRWFTFFACISFHLNKEGYARIHGIVRDIVTTRMNYLKNLLIFISYFCKYFPSMYVTQYFRTRNNSNLFNLYISRGTYFHCILN